MERNSRRADTPIAFSDEQAMLLDTATTFFRDRSPIGAVRSLIASDSGFDRAVWDEMVSLGWAGLAVPAQYGGSDLTLAEAAVIAEPMGRHLCAVPFTATQLFARGVHVGGDESQKAEYLPGIAAGATATVALTEPSGSWHLHAPECEARREGGAVRLSGSKSLATDAAAAELVLASVRYEDAPALVIVQRAELEGRLERESVIDETRRSFAISLDGLDIPLTRVMSGPRAERALAAVRNAALLLASAEAAGGTAAVLQLTVEYLNTRTAFGRKIGSFQALKHTCADVLIGLERLRSHVYHAATRISTQESAETEAADAEVALRMAKAVASEVFPFAADRAVQFHGGFGFTYECDAQLYLRRALWLQHWFGDAPHHRRRLADLMLSPN